MKIKIISVILIAIFIFTFAFSGCLGFDGFDTPYPLLSPENTLTPAAIAATTPVPVETVAPEINPTTTNIPIPSASLLPSQAPTSLPLAKMESITSFHELAPTTIMSFAELVGDNGNYETPDTFPEAGTYKIIVDVYHQVVMVYEKDDAEGYSIPVRYMVCTTGAAKTPTPRGNFLMGKRRVRFGLFVDYNVYGQYWTQVVRSIYFHSILYTKRNAKTYTTTSYKQLGKRGSHGCIRLLVPDARWIYYNIAPNTPIEIRKGSEGDTETAEIKKKLVRASLPKDRPNLKPGEVPVTDPWLTGGE